MVSRMLRALGYLKRLSRLQPHSAALFDRPASARPMVVSISAFSPTLHSVTHAGNASHSSMAIVAKRAPPSLAFRAPRHFFKRSSASRLCRFTTRLVAHREARQAR